MSEERHLLAVVGRPLSDEAPLNIEWCGELVRDNGGEAIVFNPPHKPSRQRKGGLGTGKNQFAGVRACNAASTEPAHTNVSLRKAHVMHTPVHKHTN